MRVSSISVSISTLLPGLCNFAVPFPPDPTNGLCSLPDRQTSGNYFAYRSVQIHNISCGASDAPGSDLPHTITRYWVYSSTKLAFHFEPTKMFCIVRYQHLEDKSAGLALKYLYMMETERKMIHRVGRSPSPSLSFCLSFSLFLPTSLFFFFLSLSLYLSLSVFLHLSFKYLSICERKNTSLLYSSECKHFIARPLLLQPSDQKVDPSEGCFGCHKTHFLVKNAFS